MIGSGLRSFAQERNLVVGHGVAYGLLNGYCATFSEGSGWKKMTLSTCFGEGNGRFALQQKLSELNTELQKAYGVQSFGVSERRIEIVFTDTVGTMKRINAFVNWFFPFLEQYRAAKADVCPECGMALIGGRWKLVDGVAMCVHEACGVKLKDQMQATAQVRKSNGSYLTGALGALLGALGGAVVWALIALAGYISALVGLLMGFLADKCYDLFRGKQGYGKLAILIIAVILGVLFGNYAAYVADIMNELDCSISEAMDFLEYAREISEEVRSDMTADIVKGLLFAALGVFGLFWNTKKSVAAPKYIDLD